MKGKLLLVDDEPRFIRDVLIRLKLDGFEESDIIYCSQIDEGLTALERNHNISGVSLDLLMGDNMKRLKGGGYKITGLNALKYIRECYPILPIVCFSILGEQDGGIREAMTQFNADFISKTDVDGMERLVKFFKRCHGQ